jgi:hypothetical protein
VGAAGIEIFPDTMRTIDSATFTGQYQLVGSVLTFPTRIIKIYNDASVAVTVSWDGTNDHDYLASKAFVLLDISTNREVSDILEIRKGVGIYVKAAAGTGSVYVSSWYGR